MDILYNNIHKWHTVQHYITLHIDIFFFICVCMCVVSQANSQGDYFPVWGTCLGFEQLLVITSGENLLCRTNTSGISLPLEFTPGQWRYYSQFIAHLHRRLLVTDLKKTRCL